MERSQVPEKLSAIAERVAEEMAAAVRLLGAETGGLRTGESGRSVKAEISRAARASGLGPGLVKRLRYREVRRVPADVAEAVRAALARHDGRRQRRAEAATRHELFFLRKRLERIERRHLPKPGPPR